jgi:hypothetical protein
MKTLLAGAVLFGVLAGPASAESRYDRKLEQAAIDIAVGKIGGIRGGFSFDVRPVAVIAQDATSTGAVITRSFSVSQGDAWQDGLAPAVERKGSRIVF